MNDASEPSRADSAPHAPNGRPAVVARSGSDDARQLPPAERPRERLFRSGPAALSDCEVLALLLGTGHPSLGDASVLARGLLARFGELRAVVGAGGAELAGLRGVGRAR